MHALIAANVTADVDNVGSPSGSIVGRGFYIKKAYLQATLDPALVIRVGAADMPRGWYGFFSPDGRFLRAFPNEVTPARWHPLVIDTVTGHSRELGDQDTDLGWTPDGDVLVVGDGRLSVCDVDAGTCESRPFDRGPGPLRIGGNPYES